MSWMLIYKTRQDAMKSEKVMLTLVRAVALLSIAAGTSLLVGCNSDDQFDVFPEVLRDKRTAGPLISPYGSRRLWAVAPPVNESGTLNADALGLADHLVRQLQGATNVDVLPLNRVLQTMERLGMVQVQTREDAMQLMGELGADGIIVSTITAWDPYDPPKLGWTMELYLDERVDRQDPLNLRRLTVAATDDNVAPEVVEMRQPASLVEGYYNASDPAVRELLVRYANLRGAEDLKNEAWRRYRISMDLYTEFVSYVMSWRLLHWESLRLREVELTSAP